MPHYDNGVRPTPKAYDWSPLALWGLGLVTVAFFLALAVFDKTLPTFN